MDSNEVGTAEIEKFVSTLVVILGQEKVLNKLKEINLISIDFKFCSSASFAKLMCRVKLGKDSGM